MCLINIKPHLSLKAKKKKKKERAIWMLGQLERSNKLLL